MHSSSRRRFVRRSLIAALAAALVAPAAAPLVASAAANAALVNGDAAHVSFIAGHVTIGRGTSGASESVAGLDAPVRNADYVTTGAQSRAELQFDGSASVRLGEKVQLHIAHLDADGRDIQLAAGTIDVRLLQASDGGTAIDTPSVSVIPEDAGSYRITVDDDGTTYVTVRAGHAEIQTPHGARPLDPGSTLVAQGTASDPHISARDEIAYDAFDAFDDQLDHGGVASLGDAAPSYAPPVAADAESGVPSYAQSYGVPSYAVAAAPALPSYAQPYVATYAPVYVPAYAYGYPRAYARPVFYGAPVRVWVSFGAARGRWVR